MKRINNLYDKIISIENLELADKHARKRKLKSYGVKLFDENKTEKLKSLHETLKRKEFKNSQYDVFKIYEPKERDIYRLPYYPDRIVHHAIMNVLEPIWMNIFTADTYSCIKGRGIHAVVKRLKSVLKKDNSGTKYCLKIDVKKFYPSIDNEILKEIVRRKIKDKDLLFLLDEIIDSAKGVPIGNYLSQYYANLYLSYFDHWLKEEKNVKYYFRYCDDMVILSGNKNVLHQLRVDIENYLEMHLKLNLKGNYQVFPVDTRSIDFVGYRFYHTHTLLRKSIKKRFARKTNRLKKNGKNIDLKKDVSSYWGWAKHCDSINLLKRLST